MRRSPFLPFPSQASAWWGWQLSLQGTGVPDAFFWAQKRALCPEEWEHLCLSTLTFASEQQKLPLAGQTVTNQWNLGGPDSENHSWAAWAGRSQIPRPPT